MNSLREFKAACAEWEKRVKDEGRLEGWRQMLREQLGERFGPLPADALARIGGRRQRGARPLDPARASARPLEDVPAS